MDEILVLLLKRRAHIKPVKVTTSELGSEVRMSQQNASRRLAELEKKGYLKRRLVVISGSYVTVTRLRQ